MPEFQLENLLKNEPIRLGELGRFEKSQNLVPKKEMWEKANALKGSAFPDHPVAGIYCFWWLGGIDTLNGGKTTFNIKGKHVPKKEIRYYKNQGIRIEEPDTRKDVKQLHAIHEMEWEFNKVTFNAQSEFIPLYVGKSSNIYNRIKKHFEWRITDSDKEVKWDLDYLHKPTTACQFRSGFEYLFQNEEHEEKRRNYLLDNVGLTFLPMDLKQVYERFYLEDLAIGWLRPCFNVDTER